MGKRKTNAISIGSPATAGALDHSNARVSVSWQPLLDRADETTLCRWWCELNCFKWPKELRPAPKGWDMSTDSDRMKISSARELFAELRRRVPHTKRLAYWNGTFQHGINLQRGKQ